MPHPVLLKRPPIAYSWTLRHCVKCVKSQNEFFSILGVFSTFWVFCCQRWKIAHFHFPCNAITICGTLSKFYIQCQILMLQMYIPISTPIVGMLRGPFWVMATHQKSRLLLLIFCPLSRCWEWNSTRFITFVYTKLNHLHQRRESCTCLDHSKI